MPTEWALALYAVTAVSTSLICGVTGGALGGPLFSLWTNVFYLWPVLECIHRAVWIEASVFIMTYVVSVAYHGCLADDALRYALTGSIRLLLAGGLALFASAVTWKISATWQLRNRVWGWGLAATLTAIATLVVFIGIGADGCLYPHADFRIELVQLWRAADFVTAMAAIVIVVLFFVQIPPTFLPLVFWIISVTVFVLRLYESIGLIAGSTELALILVLGGLFVIAWGVTLGCATRTVRAKWWSHYKWHDVVAAIILAIIAITLFLEFNNNLYIHGVWHMTGALTLWLVILSLIVRRED